MPLKTIFRRNILKNSNHNVRRCVSPSSFFCSSPYHGQGTSDSYSKHRETHFGFEPTNEKVKAEKVYNVFQKVASNYDLMNDVMSFGIHRFWKEQFVNILKPTPGIKILDVAGGTGDIAFRILQHLRTLEAKGHFAPEDHSEGELQNGFSKIPSGRHLPTDSHVVVADINQRMLDVGIKRAERYGYLKGISWLCADAEHLPFENASFDAYTIAFGIRNVVRIEKVLQEAWRVLKPGGRFLCLEFSHVRNPAFNWLYHNFSFEVIPVMGQVLVQDWKSYQYLVESIAKFPEQEEFLKSIRLAGFSSATYVNLSMGITAVHSGFKL